MFLPDNLNNSPTTLKFGGRPDIFEFILGFAVFVVGYLKISRKNAKPREQKTITP